MSVKIELLDFAGETLSGELYLTWTPVKVRVTVAAGTKEITLSSKKRSDIIPPNFPNAICKEKTTSPSLLFYTENDLTNREGKQVVKLTFNEGEVYKDIYVGGKYDPNMLYNGASVEQPDIDVLVNEVAVNHAMIRVRKNANELSEKAIEDFLSAISQMNEIDEEGVSMGAYSTDFFKMHVKGSASIAHGTAVFLPWHRLYILDLERNLQQINPVVSLPYWKFDEKSSILFTKQFLGEICQDTATDHEVTAGYADTFAMFANNNPLKHWGIYREKLLRRKAYYNLDVAPNVVKDDYTVFKLGDYLYGRDENNNKTGFSRMEKDPHGAAHMSNNGFINYVPTAAKDPLFYLLHCNVDRLWALWQKNYNLYDYNNSKCFPIYDKNDWKYVENTLWPWSGTSSPNESNILPPGTRKNNFCRSLNTRNFKNNAPRISDTFDYKGILNLENNLGFDYDIVEVQPLEEDLVEISNVHDIVHSFSSQFLDFKDSKSVMHIIGKLDAILSHLSFVDGDKHIISHNSPFLGDEIRTKINNLHSSELKNLKLENNINEELSKTLKEVRFRSIFDQEIEKNRAIITAFTSAISLASNNEEALFDAAQEDDFNVLAALSNEHRKLQKDFTITTKFKKSSIAYLLSLKEALTSDDVLDVYIGDNKKNIFEEINKEVHTTYLDMLIAHLSFASNSTIIEIVEEKCTYENYMFISSGVNENIAKANKLWALTNLIDNAYVAKKLNHPFKKVEVENFA